MIECFPNIGLEHSEFSWTQCMTNPLSVNSLIPQLTPQLSLFFSFCFPSFASVVLSLLYLAASWNIAYNRRKFFTNYAHEHEFDPLNPNQWYLQSKNSILSAKV